MTKMTDLNKHELNQIRSSWFDERQSSYLYDYLARAEKNPKRREMFEKLSINAKEQSKLWENLLEKKGGHPETLKFQASIRAQIVAFLVRCLGPAPLKPLLAALKVRGLSVYQDDFPTVLGGAFPKESIKTHSVHTDTHLKGNNLRAMVFGFNDGLVSNVGLMMGVIGAGMNEQNSLLTGVAGLIAGAFSMAAGEYISVRSQRELYEHQMALEREELKTYPEEEAAELAVIYEAKGLDSKLAKELSQKLIQNPHQALGTLAREELGLNPDDLGSPFRVALSSFIAFALGAMVPLLPVLLAPGGNEFKFYLMLGLSLSALFGVGAVISLFSGQRAIWGGLRMTFIGSAAGATAFYIGHLFGIQV